MISMRSVSPEGLHVQSLSEHNSFSPCEIVGFIKYESDKINMQNVVLEIILHFIVDNFSSRCKSLNIFIFHRKYFSQNINVQR